LEANAALRSIVRRDTGEGYQEFLTRLAKESGIATPTREQLAKLDLGTCLSLNLLSSQT
jgi:transposase